MNENSNINNFNRIFNSFETFYVGELDIDQLIGNLSGNITAIDNVSNEFKDNFTYFWGAIEHINYTENSDVRPELILKEVIEYESYLRSYFEEYKEKNSFN